MHARGGNSEPSDGARGMGAGGRPGLGPGGVVPARCGVVRPKAYPKRWRFGARLGPDRGVPPRCCPVRPKGHPQRRRLGARRPAARGASARGRDGGHVRARDPTVARGRPSGAGAMRRGSCRGRCAGGGIGPAATPARGLGFPTDRRRYRTGTRPRPSAGSLRVEAPASTMVSRNSARCFRRIDQTIRTSPAVRRNRSGRPVPSRTVSASAARPGPRRCRPCRRRASPRTARRAALSSPPPARRRRRSSRRGGSSGSRRGRCRWR